MKMSPSQANVTILGAGAIAYGTAALLSRDGHNVTIWSPSGRRTREIAAGHPLVATKAINGSFKPKIACTCAEALARAEVIIIAVPGYAYYTVLGAAALHLRSEQYVIFSSHMSFAALYLANLLHKRGITTPIVALGTTFVTARQPSNTNVTVKTIRPRLDAAVFPESVSDRALGVCRKLFGDKFVLRPNILAVSLANVNPEVHLAIMLCNISRIELGEDWTQFRTLTPAVGRMLEAIDAERLALADHFGLSVRTVHDHFHLSYELPYGPLGEMIKPLGKLDRDAKGPDSLNSRYITEDVPFGLVPIVRVAALAGISVPLHEAGIRLMSAICGRDFEAENNLLSELGPLSRTALTEAAPGRSHNGRL